jgi:hypothetical protein
MNFNQLSWGAFCFYYRLSGDNRYCRIMSNSVFLQKLRNNPETITPAEFEEKVLLDHINVENYDLLVGHNLARNILAKVIELHPVISTLQNSTLLECDLNDKETLMKINKVYSTLYSVRGLWLTGVSKIAHLLNDRLFALLNLDISNHFTLVEGNTGLLQWLKVTQQNAVEVTKDFVDSGLGSSPERYLSEHLGYTEIGVNKSLLKYLDEYFWLRFGDNLPVPPRWIPPFVEGNTEEN